MEVWRDKKLGFNSYGLQVSSLGNVRTTDKRYKSINDNGAGYKFVRIHNTDNKTGKNFYIHRLVAEAFLEQPCELKTQVNHIDGDKSNNNADNLEWVCPSGNIRHMHENGLNIKRRNHGELVQVSDTVVAYAYSKVVMGISSISEAAREFGFPRTTLSSIVNKRSRKNVTDGIDELLKY